MFCVTYCCRRGNSHTDKFADSQGEVNIPDRALCQPDRRSFMYPQNCSRWLEFSSTRRPFIPSNIGCVQGVLVGHPRWPVHHFRGGLRLPERVRSRIVHRSQQRHRCLQASGHNKPSPNSTRKIFEYKGTFPTHASVYRWPQIMQRRVVKTEAKKCCSCVHTKVMTARCQMVIQT